MVNKRGEERVGKVSYRERSGVCGELRIGRCEGEIGIAYGMRGLDWCRDILDVRSGRKENRYWCPYYTACEVNEHVWVWGNRERYMGVCKCKCYTNVETAVREEKMWDEIKEDRGREYKRAWKISYREDRMRSKYLSK